ncbi:MAG: cupin domain-containing protein [Syntrophaceae bacterium]
MFKRNIFTLGILVCFVFSFFIATPVSAANTTDQLLTQIDDILKANPLKPGNKLQMIKFAEDDTITFYVARIVEGAEVKPHYHKTHNETVYVFRGSGKMLINDKWVDVQPGSIHFNPMQKVHATKNIGKEDLVIFSIFTPSMKEPDRYFVK